MFRPRFPTKGKVRAGRKVNGKPQPTEWFNCETVPGFHELVGPQPNPLRIVLPYDSPKDCFTVNLERWAGTMQACYSQDGQVAKRLVGADGWSFDHKQKTRTDVQCRGEGCPDFESRACKLTGRLYFFVEGDPDRNEVYALDTHGKETIERFSAVFGVWGNGGLANRAATLAVEMKTAPGKRYPVITIVVDGAPAVATGPGAALVNEPEPVVVDERAELIALLRELGRDPKSEAVVAWVKEIGVSAALARLRARQAAA